MKMEDTAEPTVSTGQPHAGLVGSAQDAVRAAHLRERRDGAVEVLRLVRRAQICTRMRAWPFGTTGKEKPIT